MKISYRAATFIFAFFYVGLVGGMGLLAVERIRVSEIALQRFLQEQVDVDRQIVSQRASLDNINRRIWSRILGASDTAGDISFLSAITQDIGRSQKFWQKYETHYAAEARPDLVSVLADSQELDLVEEERLAVREIQEVMKQYVEDVRGYYESLRGADARIENRAVFSSGLDGRMTTLNDRFDALADTRFIFAQRIIAVASATGESQRSAFTTTFVVLTALIFMFALLEYFFIHKPFQDVILFLRDMRFGKRGQRLYFGTPIREIKESEEIINEFVAKAEEHEREGKLKK